ncbi:MAG: tetratricopeptide repeat protein [Odoribacter sp.]|nr:tetratricopeptide repeat protein [Odoribacter sp.]
MRKLTFIMVLLFCAGVTYAQPGKVSQAQSYLTSGKLDEAKKIIDEAIQHEKSKDDPRAYLIKGQIYQGIFESPIEDYKKLHADPLNVAYESYQKVIELDDKNRQTKKLEGQYPNLALSFTNKAVEQYNKEDFAGALESFKRVMEINASPFVETQTIDTAILFNTAVTAHKAGNMPEAEKYLKEVLVYNYDPGRTYAMLVNVLKEQNKDEEAVEYLQKGYEMFPDNTYMLVELINYYLGSGEPEKAEVYLDAAIAQDPNNPSFYRVKGTLYEKTEQMDKALEMYEKTLSIDPNDFIAIYNIGAIKLQEINDLHREVMEIKDVDEYNKGVIKVYEGFESVVPYFQKAYEVNPQDSNSLLYLKELYFRLRNHKDEYLDKYEEVRNLLSETE